MEQQIRFCTTSDGVRIAYAIAGSGPVLVKAPNWLTHLEYELESPVWRHWWQELTRDFTLIRFDQRGSGLSDWDVAEISFEGWVRDLEAVVNAAGVDRFALLGISQGGPVAIEYCARHPDHVTRLVLCGAFARGRLKRGQSPEIHEATITLMRAGWGSDNPAYRQLFTSQFMPGAGPDQMRWFNELQRTSTSTENAARIYATSAQIDVIGRLPQLEVPTLVMHARGDERISFEEGRLVASLIPGAHLVPLESRNHLTLGDEPAWQQLIANVRAFLGVDRPEATEPRRNDAATAGATLLTSREIEVLRLVADGKSNHEIAAELVISFNTVANHVKNILGKTGSANRTEAAAYAYRQGIASRD